MLRVGIVGCGGIAERHAGAVAALPETMQLAACTSRTLASAEVLAARHGGQACRDLDGLIAAGIDLAIVTIPPFARTGEVEQLAEAGVHLLVEKPLALDLGPAEKMVAAVEATGVTAAVGFMYRHGDALNAWRAADTGKVGLYAGTYHCNALHADWWRERTKSGGQVVEQVIHQIDLIRHSMGDPDTVYARMANLFHRDVPGYDIEDVSAIVFGWDDGRIATLNASNIAVPGLWHKDWAIYAEHLTGRFTGWNDAVLTRTDSSGTSEVIAGATDPFVAQLADLAEAIAAKRPPLVPLAEGVGATRLALAAAQSARERREVRLT
jgi:predicted dehydrogenase